MFEQAELPRSTQKEYARLVVDEADRMSAMIDEILEFTRGGATRLPSRPCPWRPWPSASSACWSWTWPPGACSSGASWATRAAWPWTRSGSERALLNIASNAMDAMEDGGAFTLASRLADGAVELTLDDTGVGIPESLRARIFEPFFTYGKPRGIGLGMSITRRIIEEHGGQVSVGDRPGGGTRFTVVLPLAPRMSNG